MTVIRTGRYLAFAVVLVVATLLSRGALAAALTIKPASATVAPLGTQMFTASGGSGTGYAWTVSTNMSGGSISAAGLYTAGATGGVMDVVQLKDSAMTVVTANVTVTSGLQVLPSMATVAVGAMQTFSAIGGTPPYTWAITTNGSGPMASITAMGGVYTAGAMAGTDIVTATDAASATASATVTVTIMKVGIGQYCMSSGQCPSGATCVDQVCCSSACSGVCQACNTSGSMGTCVTVKGPSVKMPGCPQSDPTNVCTQTVCDGTSTTSCTSLVGIETTCGVPSCIDQIGTPGAVCQGDGGCQTVAPGSCGAYACVSNACATKCTDTSECSPGNYCDVGSGKCIVPPLVPGGGSAGTGAAGGSGTTKTGGGCSLEGRSTTSGAAMFVLGLLGAASAARLRRRRGR